jgi:hypothetical protein
LRGLLPGLRTQGNSAGDEAKGVVMGRAEAEITRQLDGLIDQLQAGNSTPAESRGESLFEDLVQLTTLKPDPTERERLRFRFPAREMGLDETKTRALRSSVREALEMMAKNDLPGALDNCRKARELWTAPKGE